MNEYKQEYPIYIILLKCDKEIYIQCENNGTIIAFPTEKKALDFWENGYKSAFKRGLCGATGAMITMIQYQPRVVYFNNQKEMLEVLFNNPPFSMMHNGDVNGILCQKTIEKIWDEGKEPNLLEKR